MELRHPKNSDADALLALMKHLDEETKFMMLEPGERTATVADQRKAIESFHDSNSKVMFVADNDEQLIGFVVGAGKMANRNKHVMYCVIGILERAQARGLGTKLMTRLETWARRHHFTRLELTVMVHNHRAKALYTKLGFEVEGIKRNSLRVDGAYVDEFYMSKLLLE